MELLAKGRAWIDDHREDLIMGAVVVLGIITVSGIASVSYDIGYAESARNFIQSGKVLNVVEGDI